MLGKYYKLMIVLLYYNFHLQKRVIILYTKVGIYAIIIK